MPLLKNGSTLLLEVPTEEGQSVVLAMTEKAFATWRKDSEDITYHGDYFPQSPDGLARALKDLRERSGA